jgi:hypothetical protein
VVVHGQLLQTQIKMVNKIKKTKYFIVAFVAFTLLIPLIAAYGVTSPYWDTRPLKMNPGDTKNVVLELQNMVGGGDINLIAKVIGGNDIATLTDENLEYLVPFGKKGVLVNLEVALPSDYPIGKKSSIAISFATAPVDGGGTIQVGSGLVRNIPVETVEQPVPDDVVTTPEKSGNLSTLIFIAVITLIIIALVIFIIYHRKIGEKV